jgi:RHS repeat-associated protein
MTRVIYPDNDEVKYAYNERDLLKSISGGPTGTLLELEQYLPSAQNQLARFGNGVVSTRSCDPRQRMHSLRIFPGDTPTDPLVAFDYEFDDASNLTRIGDQRPEHVLPAGSPRRNTQVFGYDNLNRLTRVSYSAALPGQPNVSFGEINYRYDRVGNLLSQSSNLEHEEDGRSITDLGELSYGGGLGAWNRIGHTNVVPGPHALSSRGDQSYGYDLNGNATGVEGRTCTWDFRNRLVAVEDDQMRAEYTYDHADRRVIRQVTSKQQSASGPTTTFYINKYFEVRDHQQPTKFVWNGPVRVARVTGALSARQRLQRVALVAGWNLCATAVTVPQWTLPGSVTAAFRLDPATGHYHPVVPTQALSAGTVLWIQASASDLLVLQGDLPDSLARALQVPVPGGWLIRAGAVALDLREGVPADAIPWHFDELAQQWSARLPDPLPSSGRVPEFLAPGDALFVHTPASLELPAPDPALELCFYHPDHLGSSSVITDSAGQLVEETAYYPYGLPRHEFRPRHVDDPYDFGQKERDYETGLHYFEARYLSAGPGRFLSPDPLYLAPHALTSEQFESMLQNPQALNLYSYTQNNPLKYRDPSGLFLEGILDDVKRAVGLKAEVAQSGAIAKAAQGIHGTARTAIRTAYDDANMDRTVFSGHSDYPFNHPPNKLRQSERDLIQDRSQFFEVPEGTTITFYATHGMTISDRLGNAIERNTVPTQQFSETYGPGELIPNYRLMAPVQPKLHVKYRLGGGNVTVTDDVMLEDLLKPNMGPVDWAACLYDPRYGPASKVPKADFGNEEMLLHKAQ